MKSTHEIVPTYQGKSPILSPKVTKLTAAEETDKNSLLLCLQLSEFCINILHVAQKAEWLPVFMAPWSSTKKQNPGVVSAVGVQIKHAHMCLLHTLLIQHLTVCLWATTSSFGPLTNSSSFQAPMERHVQSL